MLIPVNPAGSLVRSGKRKAADDEGDVHLEVIPPKGGEANRIGRAKTTGRSVIMNRKGP